MERQQILNIVLLAAFFNTIVLVVSECDDADTKKHSCVSDGKTIMICYDGTTNVTGNDVLCMHDNECNTTYKDDVCGKCDHNPDQYPYKSQYKDCTGVCYEPDEMSSMKKVDKCGVCGGTNSTCNPTVTHLDIVLLPDTANITFNITGKALVTSDVQILLLTSADSREKREATSAMEFPETSADNAMLTDTGESTDRKRVKRRVKTVEMVLDIVKVFDETTMEIRVHNINAGTCEVGARSGDDGEDFVNHTGPVLTVYAELDYTIASMSPTEQDLDDTKEVTVTLQLETTSKDLSMGSIYDITQQFKCYFSGSMDVTLTSAAHSSAVGTFDSSTSALECSLRIPDSSKATWVCPSFNNIHLVGCLRIAFYERAPVPVEDTLFFIETADGLYVDFDKAVSFSTGEPCSVYFTEISTLGADPRCYFNEEGNRLSVMFGDGNTVSPDDTLELKAGLMPPDGEFKRQSQAVTLTLKVSLVTWNVTDHIDIATLGAWPEMLTASAESPINLNIEEVNRPNDRSPKSIIWTVNGAEQDSAKDKFKLELDVSETGEYKIMVSATDFLGGESVIRHTINKTDLDMPTVVFTDGRFIIHPNEDFTISTTIQYPRDGSSATDYNFQWKRNGTNVNGKYSYQSSKGEITIEMCGETFKYILVVSSMNDNSNSIEYSKTLLVECRDPVARISGNDMINVDVSQKDVTLFGSSSYDPDGGNVSYKWACSSSGDTDCIAKVTSSKSSSTTLSTVTISPSKMKAGKKYTISLTVSVEKTNVTYSNEDDVILAAQAGDKPVIRWVTDRTKFRHDVQIMVKAYVGTDVTVEWAFRDDLALYDWVDATNTTTGKASKVTDGYSWYTIRPGALKPGSRYKIQLNVTAKTQLYSINEYDVYIYELLRGCSVDVSTMAELEQSSVSLSNCAQDPGVTLWSTTCTAGDRELHLYSATSALYFTFIVPVFKQGVTSVFLRCKILDSIGNSLSVNSTEVAIIKAVQDKTVAQTVESLKQTGDLLGALALMSEMAEDEEDEADHLFNNQAVGLIRQIVSGDPSNDDIQRSLKSFGRLKVEKVEKQETEGLANNLVSMLDKLCRADKQSKAIAFNVDQIKKILQNTKRLMESTKKLGPLYRVAEDKLACIKIKLMQEGDFESVELENGGKHKYLVNALDDLEVFDLDLEFPEELKSKYRDQWSCGSSQKCNNVALKIEEYLSEPPDLAFGRADKECSKYVYVDLFNPLSGERISVYNLEGTVNMNLGTQCPRGQCWYYDDFLKRYSQVGVTTATGKDGSIMCQSHHLTAFTVRSEPELYQGLNLPYIICVCVGCVFLLISAAVLLKLFLVIKHRANAVDDETQLDLDEMPNYKDDYPLKKRTY
ncbi:uncharacterized protein LOC123536736 [Mercenaria mercenaria]|uniref:uncharacterized protein LOC123536736 n=1 Tax=Mercenaria mercenaria TaxID=6596 RepID=UPI00234E9CBA|nr:uncharacterized protein LOC123536736 [Mercenaria mercenaria]